MNIEKKRIYIVVKTYPQISKKYSELVCTAGLLEDGSWIRLYPVPFRKLEHEQKYKKYRWIEAAVTRNTADFRPETYRPDWSTILVPPESKTKKIDWTERRRIVLGNQKIYTCMADLIEKAKRDRTSLAVFKPAKVIDFVAEPTKREWNSDTLAALQEHSRQMNLFETPEAITEELKVVPKVPYKFSYVFEDDKGKRSKMMIEDWEIGMLYFNCLKSAGGDEEEAIRKVRAKYFDCFLKKDLHFFLGTTLRHQIASRNPFMIIGTFTPPFQEEGEQMSLF